MSIPRRITIPIATAATVATLLGMFGVGVSANAENAPASSTTQSVVQKPAAQDANSTIVFGNTTVNVTNTSADNQIYNGLQGQGTSFHVAFTLNDNSSIKSGDKFVITFPGDAVNWDGVTWNGKTASSIGVFSKDSSTHSVTLTFNRDVNGAGSFEFNVNLVFLNKASDTQTTTATAISKDGTTTPVNVVNPHYRAGYIEPPSLVGDPRAQAPDTGSLTSKYPVPNNMLYRDNGSPSITFFSTDEPYMSVYNVLDPAGSNKNDTGRSYTLSAKDILTSTSIRVENFRFYWNKDDSHLMTAAELKDTANITTTRNSDGSVTISVPDGVNDTYLNVVVKITASGVGTPLIPGKSFVNWKYNTTNNTNASVRDWWGEISYQIPDGTSGFIPHIDASDKTLKRGTALGGVNQWLLNGVTANDVEDGNLTSKVSVSNDGGFDPNTNGTYTITYAVKDSANNPVTKQTKVTVYSDVNVHYKDAKGNDLQDVKNLDGTAIANPTTLSGDGKVGQNYQIPNPAVVRASDKTYFYTGLTGADSTSGIFGDAGQATDVTMNYASDKTGVTARDVTLLAGAAYDPSLGFVSANDKTGAAVALNGVTVDGATAVDTSKAGTYQVTYSLKNSAGDTVSAVSRVVVKAAVVVTPQPGNSGNNGSASNNGGSGSGSNSGNGGSASNNNGSAPAGNSGNAGSPSTGNGDSAAADTNSGLKPVDSNNAPLSGKPAVVAAGNNANGQANASSVAAGKPAAGFASGRSNQSAKPGNGLATTGSDVIVPIVVLMVLLAAGSALTVTVVRKRH